MLPVSHLTPQLSDSAHLAANKLVSPGLQNWSPWRQWSQQNGRYEKSRALDQARERQERSPKSHRMGPMGERDSAGRWTLSWTLA